MSEIVPNEEQPQPFLQTDTALVAFKGSVVLAALTGVFTIVEGSVTATRAIQGLEFAQEAVDTTTAGIITAGALLFGIKGAQAIDRFILQRHEK